MPPLSNSSSDAPTRTLYHHTHWDFRAAVISPAEDINASPITIPAHEEFEQYCARLGDYLNKDLEPSENAIVFGPVEPPRMLGVYWTPQSPSGADWDTSSVTSSSSQGSQDESSPFDDDAISVSSHFTSFWDFENGDVEIEEEPDDEPFHMCTAIPPDDDPRNHYNEENWRIITNVSFNVESLTEIPDPMDFVREYEKLVGYVCMLDLRNATLLRPHTAAFG